jgi:hypothetical protein
MWFAGTLLQLFYRSGARLFNRHYSGFLVFSLLAAAMVTSPAVNAQNFLPGGADAAISADRRLVNSRSADDIISRMIERNRMRNNHLQNYSAVRHYEIINSNGQVSAEAVVRVDYRSPGQKDFQKISEDGSWVVRKLVFDRLLQTEEATSSGAARRESAISEENYTFTIVREEDLGANRCYVVRAEPKRTDKYLFDGELWIDAQDFAIVRISGHPAGKMSIWINRADFVREFQKIDGFWLPYRDETIVDVKIHGKKVFRIEHQQYVVNARNGDAVSLGGFAQANRE